MKPCIKRECPYCVTARFYDSYYKCSLRNIGFRRDADIECNVDEEIKRLESRILILKEISGLLQNK